MWRFKVPPAVSEFVHLDDDQGGYKDIYRKVVQQSVGECPLLLLRGGMCGLEEKDTLCDKDKAGRVQEGVSREEDEWIEEDVCPDRGEEQDEAGLRKDSRSLRRVRDPLTLIQDTLRGEHTYKEILVKRTSIPL